ncbi:MAG: ferritin [Candidatus Omnitrophota bacterium]
MISQKMQNSLNDQLTNELYSAYLYLSMAAYAFSIGLPGFARWFRVQASEEEGHAMKFFDYINEQGGRVTLKAIKEPPKNFKSAVDLFEKTLEHEKKVTATINKLVKQARSENDYATETFLQWFVTEQIEEEANDTDILQKMNLAGKSGGALLLLDIQLGKRAAEAE